MESHCIYGPAPLLSALVDARRLTAARPPRYSGSPGSLLSNSSLKAQRQPKDIFKPIHLTSPVPFQQYHGAFFLVFFFFSFCWDNGTHVSGWWKAIHNYYCSLARCIISLLFNYLYTTTFSGKSLTLAVDANFNFQYQQTESALSEILESTSVQGDKLIVRQPAPVA